MYHGSYSIKIAYALCMVVGCTSCSKLDFQKGKIQWNCVKAENHQSHPYQYTYIPAQS